MPTDRQRVQRLVRRLRLHDPHRLGQHFLIDRSVAEASMAAADIQPTDTILEIGPGLGALTELLAVRARRVVAAEKDRKLAGRLTDEFRTRPNVTIVQTDVFRVRLAAYVADRAYKLVANLPYSITSLVFRNFLTLAPRPSLMVLLIQREVADRLTGTNGNRSLLTLLADATAVVEVLRLVDRTSFWPAPEVTSALVRLRLAEEVPSDLAEILRFARMAFAGRRKQLKNSLAAGLQLAAEDVAETIQRAGLNQSARPQDLTLVDWRKLHRFFIDTSTNP